VQTFLLVSNVGLSNQGVFSMHPKMKHVYVGVDLHKENHVAVILNCWNEKLGEIQFENKPSAFSSFMEKVKPFLAEEGLTAAYGLEDIGGYGRELAMYLVQEHQIVKSVNPSKASEKRDSNPNPKKNDSWDAQCVAKVLLDELFTLPNANPQDIYFSIKHFVNRRDGLARDLTRIKKQLHNELSHHYPSYKKFFTDIFGMTALEFWHKYPAPHHLKTEDAAGLSEFLRKYSNNGLSTKKAEEILALVQGDSETFREGQEDKDFLIQSYIRQVNFTKEEMVLVESRLETMTGIDVISAADFISHIGDISRFKSANKMAKYAGIAPYEKSSGKDEKVKKSKLGDRHLHGLFYDLAVRQLAVTRGKKEPRNAVFHEYYAVKQAAGKTKKQAIVCIMRRLVNIIFSMMKNKTAYIMPIATIKQAV
jgi:transposase